MNCNEIERNLQSYVDQEMPRNELDAMTKHFSLCPPCQDKLNNALGFRNRLKGSVQIHTPEGAMYNEVKSFVYNAPIQ